MKEFYEKSLEVVYIEEPELSFGYGQRSDHPKDGLFLYGPHSGPVRSREVSVGVKTSSRGVEIRVDDRRVGLRKKLTHHLPTQSAGAMLVRRRSFHPCKQTIHFPSLWRRVE